MSVGCGDATPTTVSSAGGAGDTPTTLGGRPLSEFFFDRDRFPSALDPDAIPASQASWLADAHEVVGVEVGAEARAYPTTMLAYHHVVNDVIAGIPVCVTY